MFNLEKEVHRWCRNATPGWLFRGGQIAELEDHVHCTVAGYIQRGASEEDAFQSATKELGETHTLRHEFRKNKYMVSHMHATGMVCVLVTTTLGVSLRNEEFVLWAKSAIVALYMIPLNWLCGMS